MKEIVKEMLRIYQPISNLDWLNYKITRRNLTAHHIIKREHGGRLEMSNIAILMDVSHQYLHLIEHKDHETYVALNKIFKMINEQCCEPTESQREIIEYLLRQFEANHKWDKGSKGKLILQKKYLNREFDLSKKQ